MTDALLKKNILRTIAYFHLFKIPLTAREVRKNLFCPAKAWTFTEIRQALAQMTGRELRSQEGFYFFKDSANQLELRKTRYLISDEKIKQSRKYLKILSFVPFVRAIFICNTLSVLNANNESDIDVAIVTAGNRIWTTRFFSVILMKILKKRPTLENTKNKICLSFFVTEDALNLEKLAYAEDIHFIYWLKQFMPIYDPKNITGYFLEANHWSDKFLPNYINMGTCANWRVKNDSNFKLKLETFLNSDFGNSIELSLKKLQLKILPERLKRISTEQNTNVVLNDKVLKFHVRDKRVYYRDKWKTLCKNFK